MIEKSRTLAMHTSQSNNATTYNLQTCINFHIKISLFISTYVQHKTTQTPELLDSLLATECKMRMRKKYGHADVVWRVWRWSSRKSAHILTQHWCCTLHSNGEWRAYNYVHLWPFPHTVNLLGSLGVGLLIIFTAQTHSQDYSLFCWTEITK